MATPENACRIASVSWGQTQPRPRTTGCGFRFKPLVLRLERASEPPEGLIKPGPHPIPESAGRWQGLRIYVSVDCSGPAEGPHFGALRAVIATRCSPAWTAGEGKSPEGFLADGKELGEKQSLLFLVPEELACDVWNVAAMLWPEGELAEGQTHPRRWKVLVPGRRGLGRGMNQHCRCPRRSWPVSQ